jgi:hypothetical protein
MVFTQKAMILMDVFEPTAGYELLPLSEVKQNA